MNVGDNIEDERHVFEEESKTALDPLAVEDAQSSGYESYGESEAFLDDDIPSDDPEGP